LFLVEQEYWATGGLGSAGDNGAQQDAVGGSVTQVLQCPLLSPQNWVGRESCRAVND
jgi:hypothetical protein